MAKTGQKGGVSGIYRSDCKDRDEMTHIENTVFPPCSECHRAVSWTLVRATVRGR
jgi:hypothetical protein